MTATDMIVEPLRIEDYRRFWRETIDASKSDWRREYAERALRVFEEAIIGERPTLAHLMPLVDHIYLRDTQGCCLHLVTDDDNVETSNVAFCYRRAVEQHHRDCELAARLLLSMTRTQRHQAYERKSVR